MSNPFVPVEGGLYVIRSQNRWKIMKVLKVEEGIVHLRIYKNQFDNVPTGVDPGTLELGTINDKDGFGVGHQPTNLHTFVSWKPQFLQHTLVMPEELDGYKYWKDVGGGVWQ